MFSSFSPEVLHRHSALNDVQVADQVEIYLVLSGVARLMIPYGHGKVAMSRLPPHSLAIVYPRAYHYISWDEQGYGLVIRSPNCGSDTANQKEIWSDGDGH